MTVPFVQVLYHLPVLRSGDLPLCHPELYRLIKLPLIQ